MRMLSRYSIALTVAGSLAVATPVAAGGLLSTASQLGTVGALTGGLIGSLTGPSKNRTENALIGAGILGTLGYVVGNEREKATSAHSTYHGAGVVYYQPSYVPPQPRVHLAPNVHYVLPGQYVQQPEYPTTHQYTTVQQHHYPFQQRAIQQRAIQPQVYVVPAPVVEYYYIMP